MNPSGSNVGLFLRCAHWTKFSDPPETSNDATTVGTAFHAAMENLCKRGSVGDFTEDEGIRKRVLDMDPEGVYADTVPAFAEARAEVAYAYNFATNTSRKLGEGIGRDYGALSEFEIPGTSDLVYRRDDGNLAVVDWKTGERFSADKYADQMMFLGLCAISAPGETATSVELILVHKDEHGNLDRYRRIVGEFELLEFASKVASQMMAEGAPCAGIHCSRQWCKAVAVCDETHKAIEKMVPEDDSGYSMKILSPEDIVDADHFRWLVHRLAAVQAAHKHVMEQVKAFADSVGAVQVEDDLWYGAVKTRYVSITSTDPAEIADVCDIPFEEVVGEMKPATVKKTALERIVKKHAPPRGGKKAWDRAMAEFSYRGKTKERVVVRHDFYKKG